MSSVSTVCQTCWAEGQQIGKPCWLCHNVVKEFVRPVSEASGGDASTADRPFVATAVESAKAIPVPDSVNPYLPPSQIEDTGVYQASSALLMVMVVLVCVVFAVTVPGFGIPVCVVVLPALIRTVITLNTKRSKGVNVTTEDKVKTFFLSAAAATAAVFTAAVACIGAFFSACLVACAGAGAGIDMNDRVFLLMIGFSVIVAIGTGVYLFLHLTAVR